MSHPYAGMSVVELGAGAAIAYAGKLFADLGAQVTRFATAGSADEDKDPLLIYLDAGKPTRCFDPAQPSDRTHVRKALAGARIVFQGPSDRRFAQWDLAPEHIARAFPHLIVVSVTPFGLGPEARDSPADDLTLQALGGVSIGIGSPQRAPLKLPGDQSAFQAGLAGAIAAAGALFAREGALIDVSAADVWASFYTGVEVALARFGRHHKHRAGQRVSGQPYPRTIFRCSDGYFAVQCGESRHWQALLRMIGREELAAHPLFSNRFKANDEHADECDALIEPWFQSRTKDEVLAACLAHRIPGAPVYDIAEVLAHAHLAERDYFVKRSTARGPVLMPGSPFGALARNPRGGTPSTPGREAGSARADPRRPLAGLRVVDFGWVWAGAVPGHILADMGAEVIKVESASPLDYMRQGRPIVGVQKDPEQNPMFHNVNRGKLSLRIDLAKAQSRDVLKPLVAASDVVIENFSPGVMEKLGLGYEALRHVKPDLVMCSMSAVGQQGPLRGIRTYATMIASLAGLDSLVGYSGERVLGSQSSYADPNASLHATLGVLAALWRRRETGAGAYLDLSQWEAALSVMGEAVVRHALGESTCAPCGTRHATKSPYGNYPAAGEDRWIAIAVANDGQWRALRAALGEPTWMAAADFVTQHARCEHRAALDAQLAQETRRHEAAPLAARLRETGVPAAPLLDASGVAAEPQFARRALFELVPHPVLGEVPVYRLPWHVNGAPVPIRRRAPLLGEHNPYVLQDVLELGAERVQSLTAAGVFS